jgi:hypothetical protein
VRKQKCYSQFFVYQQMKERNALMARLVRMRLVRARHAPVALFLLAGIVNATQPWTKKDAAQWSSEEVQQLLTRSPWAQEASATFTTKVEDEPPAASQLPGPAQAGMAGRNGVSDGRWDGGVGRNDRGGMPSLSVIVRWESALPVREALQREQSISASDPNRHAEFTDKQVEKEYIISVLGLIPASRYRSVAEAETVSRSDDSVDTKNPEEMLEGLMKTSRLILRDHPPVTPEDVKLDASTGTIYLFFPRTRPISASEKEVVFATRFGSLVIEKRFHLKDMTYKGKLEL